MQNALQNLDTKQKENKLRGSIALSINNITEIENPILWSMANKTASE